VKMKQEERKKKVGVTKAKQSLHIYKGKGSKDTIGITDLPHDILGVIGEKVKRAEITDDVLRRIDQGQTKKTKRGKLTQLQKKAYKDYLKEIDGKVAGKPDKSFTVKELRSYIRAKGLNKPGIKLSMNKADLVKGLKKHGHWKSMNTFVPLSGPTW